MLGNHGAAQFVQLLVVMAVATNRHVDVIQVSEGNGAGFSQRGCCDDNRRRETEREGEGEGEGELCLSLVIFAWLGAETGFVIHPNWSAKALHAFQLCAPSPQT